MGMFRDMKDAFGVIRSDELKDLKRKADAQPKVSMMDGVKMANQAMDQAQMMQQTMPGMDPNAIGGTYAAGLTGMATVNSIADTGTFINHAPVMDLGLTITVPGREPYEITHRQLVAHAALARFQPGNSFSVRVDQQDPTKIVIG